MSANRADRIPGVAATRAVFRKFISDDSGSTAVEYGMIAGFIGLAIAATLLAIGEAIRDDVFGAISSSLQAVLGGGGGGGGGG